ncbi:uncharacterized protein FMAN_15425 [Fusarium mangiferae]|uniref:Uncharacterized protein n=1 Tax=Fusarium mangiferae TaxID=192010 RepID=A0A1L7UM11_FUSMA|nr:uncharacterized protein FMAN_15425 [Fusarium mangiferae]CVL09145.1 uncharacterized protein FMAN_15425 [Fusarium mangiferae]
MPSYGGEAFSLLVYARPITGYFLSGIIAIGAAAGATYVGLVSPTPRDIAANAALPIFRVDGQSINWHDGMASHGFGWNRTAADPAVVEWQHNHTAPVQTYYTFAQGEKLYLRHDTGLDLAIGDGKK